MHLSQPSFVDALQLSVVHIINDQSIYVSYQYKQTLKKLPDYKQLISKKQGTDNTIKISAGDIEAG